MRPELASGASTPEALNTKQLFTRLNRLNDRSRLAQAVGPVGAARLLNMVDGAEIQAQKIMSRQKWAGTLAKVVGIGGASTLGYQALTGLSHLMGGDSK